MSKKNLLPLTLAAGLFLLPLTANADGFRSAKLRRASLLDLLASPTRLVTEIWNGISGIWQSSGTSIDPDGGSSNPDVGATIDPNGGSAGEGEVGATIDPNG